MLGSRRSTGAANAEPTDTRPFLRLRGLRGLLGLLGPLPARACVHWLAGRLARSLARGLWLTVLGPSIMCVALYCAAAAAG